MTSAVVVSDVSKSFRIYRDRQRSLKATVIKGGRARYDEFWALKDIDLEIQQGKTFGLLGNNGSGKSTLLKCMAQILQPNKGSITHVGRMAAMLEVGSGFHPELSGRDNVYLNGAILGMSKAEIDRKFDSIVDFSGVGDFIDQPVKNYSSGMYVRLGFAVSIHVEPDILLVDEVLAVGDMAFQEKCTEKFAELRREGRTVIVVSHGLDQMRTFCDDAAWLRKGELMGVGPAQDVINEYADQAHNAYPQAPQRGSPQGAFGSGRGRRGSAAPTPEVEVPATRSPPPPSRTQTTTSHEFGFEIESTTPAFWCGATPATTGLALPGAPARPGLGRPGDPESPASSRRVQHQRRDRCRGQSAGCRAGPTGIDIQRSWRRAARDIWCCRDAQPLREPCPGVARRRSGLSSA